VTTILRYAISIGALLVTLGVNAWAAPPQVVHELAPDGSLRAAINFGNPVLAQRPTTGDQPHGVSVELARELGRELGVPVKFVFFNEAGRVPEALKSNAWDIAFLAIDPVRARGIAFTAPYVEIDGAYLVASDSPLQAVDDVDKTGRRIAVATGSAYDLYLTRALEHAQLVRLPDSAAAVEAFERQHLDALAGVRQPLVAFAAAHPGARVLPGRFMAIEQAMGTPQGRDAGLSYLRGFVERMKASGFVANALAATGQDRSIVAPAAPATEPGK
jgi:polar amino acid transport system substrate-binding protein